ncbi:MAG: RNA pseudouridine synthase [Alistipes sp.]|nr:RNA pseudouridine synthase [Alistipes sp.]
MFHSFERDITGIELPTLFTWPFHYVPHALCVAAKEQVEQYLSTQSEWTEELQAGKMMGVLVVENKAGEVGFVAAFSGNLAGTNTHPYFVPPVYDMLRPEDFFKREEAEISAINRKITELEFSDKYQDALNRQEQNRQEEARLFAEFKVYLQQRKQQRDMLRDSRTGDEEKLKRESQRDNADFQRLKRTTRGRAAKHQEAVNHFKRQILALEEERVRRSKALQMALFERFRLLNANGEIRDLCEIFAPTKQGVPPAGAAECAAPKMLQYAYKNGLKPLAMAEFWQGRSPYGEVRHHGEFYPSCNSRCKPILTYMMQGLNVEPNPLEHIVPAEPEILYEDEDIMAINKPCGMLSVEGKSGVISVERWYEERFGKVDHPIIVHRLDQSTSGILLLAKNKEAHKALQEQFIKQTIKKRYTALLEGEVSERQGVIDLPMKLDYDNRPRQMVAPDGKQAITRYVVIAKSAGTTRVRFYPQTGRTHQLRLHAAHAEGLGCPIVGDDIYGTSHTADCSAEGRRLCLHADEVTFHHPTTGEQMVIRCKAEF